MKAKDIIGYVIVYGESVNRPVTNLRLQAFLFLIQKISLWDRKLPSFDEYEVNSEDVFPCFPSIYKEFSMYAGIPIVSQAIPIHIEGWMVMEINKVFDKFADYATWKLVDAIREYYRNNKK